MELRKSGAVGLRQAANAEDAQPRDIGSAEGQLGHHETSQSARLAQELGRVAHAIQMDRVGRNGPVHVRLECSRPFKRPFGQRQDSLASNAVRPAKADHTDREMRRGRNTWVSRTLRDAPYHIRRVHDSRRASPLVTRHSLLAGGLHLCRAGFGPAGSRGWGSAHRILPAKACSGALRSR